MQWPDLVEQALFEEDPARRPQLIEAAVLAIEKSLHEIKREKKQMLLETREKLKALR